jgi:threonine dehydrogenase-like Zn-dependent dehydrogenase
VSGTSTVATTRAVRTMRAAVLAAPGRVAMRDVACPEPGRGEVRVRLEGSGVCASNLPMWEGREWFEYPQPPGTPGHEGWGVIDAVGPAVDGIAPGVRVAALSQRAYAAYDIASAEAVVPLPASLDGMPVPGEALGCAMNIYRRSGIEPGQTVAIVGIGFLGALLTQLASRDGARVIAISRRPFSLDVAREQGAAEVVRLGDRAAVIERVQELTDGAFCDRVIEAVGLQEPLDLAGALTRERGRLVIAGFHQDGPRQIDMFLWNWRGIDVINAHERDPVIYAAGIRAAVQAVEDGRLDPRPLITHHFPLSQLGNALDAVRHRPDGFLKAVVTT